MLKGRRYPLSVLRWVVLSVVISLAFFIFNVVVIFRFGLIGDTRLGWLHNMTPHRSVMKFISCLGAGDG